MRLLQRSVAALALVLLTIGPASAPAFAQNERPDLAIEVLGLKAGSQREVRLRVTNVGEWWADETTAVVETVAPAAGNKVTVKIPDLDPKQQPPLPTPYQFEFSYTLPADCAGHVVKADLAAAATWNKNKETNLANNVAQRELCPKPSSGPPPIVQSGGLVVKPVDPALVQLPAHMRPGEHTLTFEPSAVKSVQRITGSDAVGAATTRYYGGEELLVGWSQLEYTLDPFDGSVVSVGQTAVKFDLGKLDEISRKHVIRATLSFDEQAYTWKDADRNPRLVPGCVAVLGIATVEWAGQPINALFPNGTYEDVTPGSTRAWDVTSHVRDLLHDRSVPRHGYVLRGSLEELAGEDDTSCMSTVSNIRLQVTYLVPQ
jgi:hypothetical protein